MAGYRLTARAREGLREILEYVDERFGNTVAERVLDRMEEALTLLSATPGAGHRREDLTDDVRVRFWSVGPSLIAYRAGVDDVVEVLMIERGERDWGTLIEDELE